MVLKLCKAILWQPRYKTDIYSFFTPPKLPSSLINLQLKFHFTYVSSVGFVRMLHVLTKILRFRYNSEQHFF
jgi:hypothetical protein